MAHVKQTYKTITANSKNMVNGIPFGAIASITGAIPVSAIA